MPARLLTAALLAICLLLGLQAPPAAAAALAPTSTVLDPAVGIALGNRVSDALSAAGASTIAAAVDVDGYGPVLRRGGDLLLPPASTQKTVTGLSALLALGPEARFTTQVVTRGRTVLGRLRGDLHLVAGGDPYLTRTDLQLLARRVKAAGISSVAGDVLLDDLRYDQRRNADGWRPTWVPEQSGPLSALAVDGNRWRRDATFLADPAVPAALLFRDLLRAEGVQVGGTVRRAPQPAGTRVLAVHRSVPVPQVVQRALKASDNFASELLLKELGRVVRGDGSSAGGVLATRGVLADVGVQVGPASDGSGLSSGNRQTPAGMVRLLQSAETTPSGPAFRAALPIGCRDGTLRNRFCGTAAEGRVLAKTGTLSGVRALVGYTRTASGRDVHFAVQLSGVTDGGRALAAIDRAIVMLASATE